MLSAPWSSCGRWLGSGEGLATWVGALALERRGGAGLGGSLGSHQSLFCLAGHPATMVMGEQETVAARWSPESAPGWSGRGSGMGEPSGGWAVTSSWGPTGGSTVIVGGTDWMVPLNIFFRASSTPSGDQLMPCFKRWVAKTRF